jgi:plastocyanin
MKITKIGYTCVRVLFASAMTVALLAACAKNANSREEKSGMSGAEVKIDNFTYAPGTITVAPGTTVQWVNHDDIPHTVVSDDKTTFKSKALDTDDKFTYTFAKPGTYTYFCSIHPKMTAKVVVQ